MGNPTGIGITYVQTMQFTRETVLDEWKLVQNTERKVHDTYRGEYKSFMPVNSDTHIVAITVDHYEYAAED